MPAVKFKPGAADDPPAGEIESDAVESWGFTDNGLKLVMKLRANLRSDPRPPTNGRVLTSADVKWSWDCFSALGTQRGDYDNKVNPGCSDSFNRDAGSADGRDEPRLPICAFAFSAWLHPRSGYHASRGRRRV